MMVIDPSRVVVWLDKWEMMSGMFPGDHQDYQWLSHIWSRTESTIHLSTSWKFQMAKVFQESQQNRHRNRNPISPICSAAAGEGNGGGEMVHSNVEKKTVAPETKKTQYKYTPGSTNIAGRKNGPWRCISYWKRWFSMAILVLVYQSL